MVSKFGTMGSWTITTTTSIIALATGAIVIHRLLFRRHRLTCPPFPEMDLTTNPKRTMKKTNLPRQADIVIIGSGPSGLAAACLLTQRGYKVLVLEQHDRLGGGLHSFVEKGKYEFDTGFHYAGEMNPHEPLRKIVNHLTRGEVEWSDIGDCPVAPGIYDQVHFLNEDYSNGGKLKPFDVYAGKDKWVQELKQTFPEEIEAIDTYVAEMEACAKTTIIYAIWRSLSQESFLAWITRPLLAAPQIKYNSQVASDRLDELTSNERLKAVLGYVSMGCVGVCPDKLHYCVMLGLHAHFVNGAHYPVKGSSAIAAAMVRTIESGGGRVLVNAAVDRVLVTSTKDKTTTKVVGVKLKKNGLVVHAPVVISSIGLRETVNGLLRSTDEAGLDPINSGFSGKTNDDGNTDPLPPEKRWMLGKRLEELPWGTGHIFGFVGIRDDTIPSLDLPKRNCWFLPSYNLRDGADAFESDPQKPFGYVALAFPSKKDPSYSERVADGVVSAIFVAGDVPWEWFQQWADTRVHKRGDDYETFKDTFKARLLDVLYLKYPQVKGRVEYVDLGTPVDTRTYLGRMTGASYGIPPSVAKAKADATWLRPKMPGLLPDGMYLAGQDVTVDGFAPAVMSGLMVTAAVDGVLSWMDVVPMLGGWIETAKII